jgi:hypothetical protein
MTKRIMKKVYLTKTETPSKNGHFIYGMYGCIEVSRMLPSVDIKISLCPMTILTPCSCFSLFLLAQLQPVLYESSYSSHVAALTDCLYRYFLA